jgi:gliding motility-associated-like protein
MTIRSSILTLFILVLSITAYTQPCGCNFVVGLSATETSFDGIAKGVKPGDKICFTSGTRTGIGFKNITGTPDNPVIITNMCDGKVLLQAPPNWGNAVETINCSYIRFTGSGNPNEQYGIEIRGAVHGINFHELSTNFEVDHLRVNFVGGVGIVAKTDPTCDPKAWRGNFTMRDCRFHDNYISDTGNEGFYIGNSHADGGVTKTCNGSSILIQEHEVDGIQVYDNILRNIGNEAIQVGAATNAVIHHNNAYNFGAANNPQHQTGIQVGNGTQLAKVYNNIIDTGTGYGIYEQGGGGTIYNNIFANTLLGGIILQDLAIDWAPAGFTIVNNTFINCKDFGVLMFSENPKPSYYYNNIVVGQNQATYKYVNFNNPSKNLWIESNNLRTQDISTVKFVNPAAKDYHLLAGSAAIDGGKDLTAFGIGFDLDEKTRPKGSGYDIGAYEFQPNGPSSNAGQDQSITLPTNSIILNGSGTSATGITGYQWTKVSGGAAVLTNELTPNLSVSGLVAGTYVFELRVTDASGFDFDNVTVNVLPVAVNQNPVANAGTTKTITLPTNTLILNGIGTDPDGSIATYLWTKVSGPTATLTNASTPNLSLSNLLQGTYVFQLTVTDDKGATGSAQVTVIVNPVATNQIPIVNAGTQKTVFLPVNQVSVTATASDPDGSIATILWEKKSGGAATLSNTNTLTLTASGLVAGNYTFRITVTDNKGATAFSEVLVIVIQANQSPSANAGSDQSLTLPTNSIILTGSGIDPDGSVVGYSWIKSSGPTATLTNTNTATLTITNMLQGTYIFSLTVTDNNGATGNDVVIVTVNVAANSLNEIPLALAGGNVAFALPTNSVNLFGSGFDPDGTISSYSWTKASGGSVTLTNTTQPTLSLSNLQAGQYTFRLTVTDDKGATDDDIAIVTVSSSGTNIFPIASAGADKIIKLPFTTAILEGSGTDQDGQITSYLWSQTSGSAATISSSATPTTTISGLSLGDYVFRLTVTDDKGASDFNDVNVRVVSSTNNLPPFVDAGSDIKIFLPQNTLIINALASDDGVITSYLWSKLSGPTVTLINPSEQNLSLSNLVLGDYTFQLTVTDNNQASVFDIVKVSVLPANFAPPVVDAGSDQTLTLPVNQTTLTGAASSPTGTIVSTVWTKTIGPAATLTGSSTLTVQVSGMVVGTYIFKLTATDDSGKETSDNVQVIVNPIPPNQAPVVSAGLNTSVTFPTSQVALAGTATDLDGSVVTLAWSQILGPSPAVFQNGSTLNATATNLEIGTYIFRLSATDNLGLVGFAEIFVVVTNPLSSELLPPVVSAGDDVALIFPDNQVTINGNAFDPDGSIEDTVWEQVGGSPTSFEVSNGTILMLTDLLQGTYTFRLTATDNDLQTAMDEVQISVVEKDDEIPKFFSPNNDGIGDVWVFRNINDFNTCKLRVFSRSGQVVYEAGPYQNDWSGTYNGKSLSDGDYYYNLKCDDGRAINGAVRIIR